MQSDAESSKLPAEDYQAIEDAVMETARGRWFLAEYARRHRVAETEAIVSQLERMEKMIRRERQVPDIDRIRLDLADMAEAIHRTKAEIAQMQMETGVGGRFAEASSELDAIVTQTETATDTILLNAEKVQEMAWSLREAGVDDALCDQLDQNATEIYTACSFQDLTGQRTRKVVTVLRYLESRINSMIGIWGLEEVEDAAVVPDGAAPAEDARPDAHLLNGPARLGEGIDQSAVDDLMDFSGTPEADVFEAIEVIEAAAEPEAEADDAFPPARPFSTADFEIRPRRAYDVIDDDITIVVPVEVAFAEPGDEITVEAPAASAIGSARASAGADVFALRDEAAEPPVLAVPPALAGPAQAAPEPDFDVTAADVFAPALRRATDPVTEPGADADVFAATPMPGVAPSETAPKARPRARAAKPAVHGNTALAVAVADAMEPEVLPAEAPPEPVLAVVPNADPIAALSPAEKLIVFG